MSVPPVLQQPPKKSDPLLRNVLIAGGVVCTVILVAGAYVFFQFFTGMLRGMEGTLGKKQPVKRELANGWKEVHLPDLDWTLELPAVARKHKYELGKGDEDTSAYSYYSFWDFSVPQWGEIESTSYKEDNVWTAKELIDFDQGNMGEEGAVSQFKSSHRELQTGGRPAYLMTYRYYEDGDKTVNLRVYWQHVRQLHSISLEFPESEEKKGRATFDRIWKSLKPPVVPTRSPSG